MTRKPKTQSATLAAPSFTSLTPSHAETLFQWDGVIPEGEVTLINYVRGHDRSPHRATMSRTNARKIWETLLSQGWKRRYA